MYIFPPFKRLGLSLPVLSAIAAASSSLHIRLFSLGVGLCRSIPRLSYLLQQELISGKEGGMFLNLGIGGGEMQADCHLF